MIDQNLILTGAAVIGVLLLLFLAFQLFLLRSRLNHMTKKYDTFMHGKDGGSLEVILNAEIRELRDMVNSSKGMLHQQELLATMQLKSIQKTGLVRYDAFEETGDRLSFSLTLLDGNNNGIVLSSISGEETGRIYCKQVIGGQCRESLSAEEAESIDLALQTLVPDAVAQAAEQNREQGQPEDNRAAAAALYGVAYERFSENGQEEEPVPADSAAIPDKHKIDMK